MKVSDMYKGDMLDIIFEDRNKEYGAYFLRRTYGNRVTRAILYLLLGLALLATLDFVLKAIAANKEVEEVEDVTIELLPPPPLDPTKPPPPPPPPVKTPPPSRPTVKFVPPKLVEDKKVVEEVPPPKEEDLKDKEASTETKDGDKNALVVIEDPGIGDVKETVIETPPPPKEEIFEFAEQMPEFPGGSAELMKYLSKNIKYPDIARENGYEGTVALSFIVDASGNISDVSIIRDQPGGLGAEAVRVVKSMPPWKPGKQNGKPVKVKYKLPVKFKLN